MIQLFDPEGNNTSVKSCIKVKHTHTGHCGGLRKGAWLTAFDKGWEVFIKKSSVRMNNMSMLLSMNINTADMPRAGESGSCVALIPLIRMILARSWIQLT